MKKIILSAIVALSALAADAQVWGGGTIGFGVKDNDAADKTELSYEIGPEIGYSINEKWDIAIALKAQVVNNAGGVSGKDVNNYTVNPYVRYTFANSGIASFFVEGTLSFSSNKMSGSDAVTGFGIGVRPGVKFAISDKVFLVSKLGYLGYQSQKYAFKAFGFNANNSISLGMFYNF